MFTIKIADIYVKIDNKYSFIERQCAEYIVNIEKCDLFISVSEEELEQEKSVATQEFSPGYIESICCYRKISLEITKFDIFLMHAAVVAVDNEAYAFSAKSGTGKTTHTRLWKELLKDKMYYVNGDKPLIRLIDGIPYAYGTPWCGKEAFQTNTKARLKALCCVERGEHNSITELPKQNVLVRVIHQILIPDNEEQASKTFELLDQTINNIDTYVLKCNMDLDAAKLSYSTMSKKTIL